jgi:hypothetical protein
MGQVFKNPTIPHRRASYGQRRYLAAKKSDRETKNVKHEQSIQKDARDWFVVTFPGEHFVSDTGSGAFNSEWAKDTHSAQQSHKREPDIDIRAARRGYHGLLIELKADCHCKVKTPHKDCALRMQSDGRVIKVYKNSRGKIIGRDYRVRLKGEWKDLHVELQAKNLEDYLSKGYYAHFAIGLEAFKKICCWYFDVPYVPPPENTELTF